MPESHVHGLSDQYASAILDQAELYVDPSLSGFDALNDLLFVCAGPCRLFRVLESVGLLQYENPLFFCYDDPDTDEFSFGVDYPLLQEVLDEAKRRGMVFSESECAAAVMNLRDDLMTRALAFRSGNAS